MREPSRRKRFVAAVSDGATVEQAKQLAPYAANVNNATALALTEALNGRLDAAGLTEQYSFARLKEKLNATETKFFANKGIVTDTHRVKAHGIQWQAIVALLKMRGLLTDRGINVNVDGGNVGILVSDGTPHAHWVPQLPNGNTNATVPNDTSPAATTVTSTIEGTGKRRGGLGHDHRNRRHTAASVPNSKVGRALRKSNGRHGAGANIPNGQCGRAKSKVKVSNGKSSSKRGSRQAKS